MMVTVFTLAIVAISVFEAIRVNNQINAENK
jgi:hypothetical protein